MRVLCIAMLLAAALQSQQPQRQQTIPAGTALTRIALNLKQAPEIGDRFGVYVSTDKVKVSLVAANGRRIGPGVPEESGIRWNSLGGLTPPIGSSDGGQTYEVQFVAPGTAGRYVFEFDARAANSPATVRVSFVSQQVSRAKDFEGMLHSLRGAQRVGPVVLTAKHSSATLDVNLPEAMQATIIDVVTTDPSAKVGFALPSGRVIDTPEGNETAVAWKSIRDVSEVDDDTGPFSMSAFLAPVAGMHHVFTFETATAGRYHVRAQLPPDTTTTSGSLTATVMPVSEWLKAFESELQGDNDPRQPTHMRVFGEMPGSIFSVGDPFEIQVDFVGVPIADAPTFRVLMEYRENKDTPPTVENVGVEMVRTPEGRYAGQVTPLHAGILRVGIHASGKNTQGKSFSDDGMTSDLYIKGKPDDIVSLRANAVPRAGMGRFERLDVVAKLDVLTPGKYSIRGELTDSSSRSIDAVAQAELRPGAQSLTVSFPASRIRTGLNDGPYMVRNVSISGPGSPPLNASGLSTGPLAYRRDQWDPGEFWMDDRVVAQGVYPSASGRFRMVEVDWGITTPGGVCRWRGMFGPAGSPEFMSVGSMGVLPAGPVKISLVFDAAMLIRHPDARWTIDRSVSCSAGILGDYERKSIPVALDVSELELLRASFSIDANDLLRMRRDQSVSTTLNVRRNSPDGVAVKVGELPDGIRVTDLKYGAMGDSAHNRYLYIANVSVGPTVPFGRYFIPIVASTENETAATALIVDVVP